MAPARSPRTENSAAGLVLLDAEHTVVVTGEERHQATLSAFAPGGDGRSRQVAVALRPAPVTRGRQAGHPGVEVLLNGQRVGELTPRMAQRYRPLIDRVLHAGGRPGCLARVIRGRHGLEVELRLPVSADPAGVPAPSGPDRRPILPQPPGRPSGRRAGPRSRTPLWIGAGAAATLLVIGASIGSAGHSASPPGTVSAASSSGAAAPTPTSTPASAATIVPDDAAPTSTTLRVPPPPTSRKSTARRAPEPAQPEPEPTPAPKPSKKGSSAAGGGCDSNYSGCVPIASDVDCTGGGGNGPKYVSGPLRVTGTDVYDLDRDGDGIACE